MFTVNLCHREKRLLLSIKFNNSLSWKYLQDKIFEEIRQTIRKRSREGGPLASMYKLQNNHHI